MLDIYQKKNNNLTKSLIGFVSWLEKLADWNFGTLLWISSPYEIYTKSL